MKKKTNELQSKIIAVFLLLTAITVFLFGTKISASAAISEPELKASWNSKIAALQVSGRKFPKGAFITIKDSGNGKVLGTSFANKSGSFSLTINKLTFPPFSITAVTNNNQVTKKVENRPRNCATAPQPNADFKILGFNNLGMHCYDSDFSVFSILPPFNEVEAQVIQKGVKPKLLDDSKVEVYYTAVPDLKSSINTTSINKTNFWDYVQDIFGVQLSLDEGLLGAKMPGSANAPQVFNFYQPDKHWFSASGIPITAIDDKGQKNHYPMLRITAVDKLTKQALAKTDIVVPVSDEMHCGNCHATDETAANSATAAKYGVSQWSASGDSEIAYRENILILHDAKHDTPLYANQPVLCASCHYSPALDLAGTGPQGKQIDNPLLSFAIHGRHGKTLDNNLPSQNDPAIIPEDGTTSCYACHPGSATKCLRGTMASNNLNCQNCHGGMLSVAGTYKNRTPWLDEPKCQSCHTGDAVDHVGAEIIRRYAYDTNDPSATPIEAANKRFAEEDNTLYRFSLGHGKVACESCHGSTHAEWPSLEPNDNVASNELQGHAGALIECNTCHTSPIALTMNGPHGLHNVNDPRWNKDHEEFYEANKTSCQACHGLQLEGTVLSKTAVDRNLVNAKGVSITIPKGTPVSCQLCHENPLAENEVESN